jgi:hypothetical protein
MYSALAHRGEGDEKFLQNFSCKAWEEDIGVGGRIILNWF